MLDLRGWRRLETIHGHLRMGEGGCRMYSRLRNSICNLGGGYVMCDYIRAVFVDRTCVNWWRAVPMRTVMTVLVRAGGGRRRGPLGDIFLQQNHL
jgi:hypothetical protein